MLQMYFSPNLVHFTQTNYGEKKALTQFHFLIESNSI